jgi:S-adenosylhomocysteine hydrolase
MSTIGSITIETSSVELDNGENLRDLAIGDSVELRPDTGHGGLWIAASFSGDCQAWITLQHAQEVMNCGVYPELACQFHGTWHAHPFDLDGNMCARPTA